MIIHHHCHNDLQFSVKRTKTAEEPQDENLIEPKQSGKYQSKEKIFASNTLVLTVNSGRNEKLEANKYKNRMSKTIRYTKQRND